MDKMNEWATADRYREKYKVNDDQGEVRWTEGPSKIEIYSEGNVFSDTIGDFVVSYTLVR